MVILKSVLHFPVAFLWMAGAYCVLLMVVFPAAIMPAGKDFRVTGSMTLLMCRVLRALLELIAGKNFWSHNV
jgi:hypothetical protein